MYGSMVNAMYGSKYNNPVYWCGGDVLTQSLASPPMNDAGRVPEEERNDLQWRQKVSTKEWCCMCGGRGEEGEHQEKRVPSWISRGQKIQTIHQWTVLDRYQDESVTDWIQNGAHVSVPEHVQGVCQKIVQDGWIYHKMVQGVYQKMVQGVVVPEEDRDKP